MLSQSLVKLDDQLLFWIKNLASGVVIASFNPARQLFKESEFRKRVAKVEEYFGCSYLVEKVH